MMTAPISNVAWPALVSGTAARSLAVQFQLDQSQWWPQALMRSVQGRQLDQLLMYARRFVPFYRKRFRDFGSSGDSAELLRRWHDVPFLTRADIQASFAHLQSNAIPKDHGKTHRKFTGGSTGQPVVVTGTDVTQFLWNAFTLREHYWHRRDFAGTLGVIRYVGDRVALPPRGKVSRNWGPATKTLLKTGKCATLNITSTTDEQVEWLESTDPTYLLTYPSVVDALARYCIKNRRLISNLTEVRTFGEVLETSVREICREAWGVDVVDVYSSEEVGYIALQCPSSSKYHVLSEHLFVEILDQENRPCRAGEIGKVVVTTLNNFAMPLIRYDIGDFAEVGADCGCGRTLPILNRIVGRTRNMLVLPDGRLRWPSIGEGDVSELLAGPSNISQLQVVQRDLTQVDVNVVCPTHLSDRQEYSLKSYVREALGHPFHISIRYRDRIERSPTGKYEDFRSEVRLPV